jgi:hypothetical protein
MHIGISIKGMVVFLERAINTEIGKETDDRERRGGLIFGSLPEFSMMD